MRHHIEGRCKEVEEDAIAVAVVQAVVHGIEESVVETRALGQEVNEVHGHQVSVVQPAAPMALEIVVGGRGRAYRVFSPASSLRLAAGPVLTAGY